MSDEHTLYTIEKLIHTWRVKDMLERTNSYFSSDSYSHVISKYIYD